MLANATLQDVVNPDLSAYRIQRLEALLAVAPFEGNKAELGRKLGYKDGAFIGQLLRGEREITEKTIAKVHAMRGFAGWFDKPTESKALVILPPKTPGGIGEARVLIDRLGAMLSTASPDTRSTAAGLLRDYAIAPTSKKTANLLALLLADAIPDEDMESWSAAEKNGEMASTGKRGQS